MPWVLALSYRELRPFAKLGLPMLPGIYPSAHARLLEHRYQGAETTRLSRPQDPHTCPQGAAFGWYGRHENQREAKSAALDSFPAEEMAHHSGMNGFEEHSLGGGCSSHTDGAGRTQPASQSHHEPQPCHVAHSKEH